MHPTSYDIQNGDHDTNEVELGRTCNTTGEREMDKEQYSLETTNTQEQQVKTAETVAGCPKRKSGKKVASNSIKQAGMENLKEQTCPGVDTNRLREKKNKIYEAFNITTVLRNKMVISVHIFTTKKEIITCWTKKHYEIANEFEYKLSMIESNSQTKTV